MKKTNVMIEVSDDLYNDIIEPYKKRKSFGRLVVHLLEAYRSNDAIYSFINGAIDGLENESQQELLKDLNSMTQSLNMMGLLQSQAEVVIDEGQRAVDEFSSQAKKDLNNFNMPKDEKGILTRDDVISIVNDSVSDIRDMLKSLIDKGKVSEPIMEKVQGAVETKINAGLADRVAEKVNTSSSYVPKEVSEQDVKEADAAIASLLGSISY